MYPKPLGVQARRHLHRLVGALLIASRALAPPLWVWGAFSIFVWARLVLTGILALAEREDPLHTAQGFERHTRGEASGAAPAIETMPRRLGRVAPGRLVLAASVPLLGRACREEGTNSTFLTVPPKGRRPGTGFPTRHQPVAIP